MSDTSPTSGSMSSCPVSAGRVSSAHRVDNSNFTSTQLERLLFAAVPAVVLFFVPGLLWTNFFGSAMNLGGDVPNIILQHPLSFLRHLGFSTVGNGLNGYNQAVMYDPLALVAVPAHWLHVNPQAFLSGLTLAAGYTSVRLLVAEYARSFPGRAAMWGSAQAGIVATMAPMLGETVWSNFLPRVYLIAIVPTLCLCFLRYVRTGRPGYLILSIVTFSMGSAALSDVPASLPSAVFAVVAIAIGLRQQPGQGWLSVTTRSLTVALPTTLAGGFWLVPFVTSVFYGQQQVRTTLSAVGKQQAVTLAHVLAPLQDLRDAVSLQLSHPMMAAYDWPQNAVYSWTGPLWVIGALPLLIGLAGVVLGASSRSSPGARRLWHTLLALLFTSIGFLALVSLRLPGSLSLYDWMLTHVPGWVATRNFWGTFATSYVLSVALLSGVGVVVIATVGWPRAAVTCAAISLFGFLVLGAPLIGGTYFSLPYYQTLASHPPNRVLSSLPSGYARILSEVTPSNAGGGVLTLPLTTTDWSYLTGNDSSGHPVTYIGVSPLFFWTGIPDYNGLSTFSDPLVPGLSSQLGLSIQKGNSEPLANVVRLLGIHWVVLENFSTLPTDFGKVSVTSDPAAELSFDRALLRNLGATEFRSSAGFSLWRVGTAAPATTVRLASLPPASIDPHELALAAAGVKPAIPQHCSGWTIVRGGFSTTGPVVLRHHGTGVNSSCVALLLRPFSSAWSASVLISHHPMVLYPTVVDGFAPGFRLPHLRGKATALVTFRLTNNRVVFDGFVVSGLGLVLGLAGSLLEWRRSRHDKMSLRSPTQQ